MSDNCVRKLPPEIFPQILKRVLKHILNSQTQNFPCPILWEFTYLPMSKIFAENAYTKIFTLSSSSWITNNPSPPSLSHLHHVDNFFIYWNEEWSPYPRRGTASQFCAQIFIDSFRLISPEQLYCPTVGSLSAWLNPLLATDNFSDWHCRQTQKDVTQIYQRRTWRQEGLGLFFGGVWTVIQGN